MAKDKALKKYIGAIDSHKAINLPKFIELITKLSIDHEFQLSDIKARKIKGSMYLIEEMNESLISVLRLYVASTGDDRISAAKQNKSHSHKVKGSVLIVREGLSHPNVVLFEENGDFVYPGAVSKRALLIENRQNFISIDKTLRFLEEYTDFKKNNNISVIFAVGNEISNSLHRKFLAQFEHLYYYFDLDLGGLTIAKNISAMLSHKNIDFLIPSDIETRLANVIEKKDKDYIDKVVKLGTTNPMLIPYVKLIRDYRRVLEQEGHLHE